MPTQPVFQFGSVPFNPTPDCGAGRLPTTLAEQFFEIAERERVPEDTSGRRKE